MGSSLLWQTDTQLRESVQRQLEWDPEIDASRIAIIASDGVITLTGFVQSYAAKMAAEQSVKRVRGVRGVANDIQVALRSERTDPDIAADAVHALRAHTSVPNRVTVTVRQGFLTLDGSVDWMFQKVAAAVAVASLDGVKGVSNLIQVTPSALAGQIRPISSLRSAAARKSTRSTSTWPSTAPPSRCLGTCAHATNSRKPSVRHGPRQA